MEIEVRDILALARTEMAEPKDELKRLYEWRFEYKSTGAKAIVGAGASLVVAVLAAALQHQEGDSWLPVALGALGASVVLIAGVVSYRRIRAIYREYVTAQELLSDALQIRQFLKLYRDQWQ